MPLSDAPDRGAVNIDAANAATGNDAVELRTSRGSWLRRRFRMLSTTPSMLSPVNGCSPDTISYSTTHSDQTSSASLAGPPPSTSGDR